MTDKAIEVNTRENPGFNPEKAKKEEHAKMPQQDAATTCYVASSPALTKVSGAYFADCNIATPGGRMLDDALAARLWTVSEDLTRPYLKRPVA